MDNRKEMRKKEKEKQIENQLIKRFQTSFSCCDNIELTYYQMQEEKAINKMEKSINNGVIQIDFSSFFNIYIATLNKCYKIAQNTSKIDKLKNNIFDTKYNELIKEIYFSLLDFMGFQVQQIFDIKKSDIKKYLQEAIESTDMTTNNHFVAVLVLDSLEMKKPFHLTDIEKDIDLKQNILIKTYFKNYDNMIHNPESIIEIINICHPKNKNPALNYDNMQTLERFKQTLIKQKKKLTKPKITFIIKEIIKAIIKIILLFFGWWIFFLIGLCKDNKNR